MKRFKNIKKEKLESAIMDVLCNFFDTDLTEKWDSKNDDKACIHLPVGVRADIAWYLKVELNDDFHAAFNTVVDKIIANNILINEGRLIMYYEHTYTTQKDILTPLKYIDCGEIFAFPSLMEIVKAYKNGYSYCMVKYERYKPIEYHCCSFYGIESRYLEVYLDGVDYKWGKFDKRMDIKLTPTFIAKIKKRIKILLGIRNEFISNMLN